MNAETIKRLMPKGLRLAFIGIASFPILCFVLVLFIVFKEIDSLGKRLDSIIGNTVPAVTLSIELRDRLNLIEGRIWKNAWLANDKEKSDENLADLQNDLEQIDSINELYGDLVMPEIAAKLREKLNQQLTQLHPVVDSMKSKLKDGQTNDAREFYERDVQDVLTQIRDTLSNIELNNSDILEKYRQNATQKALVVMLVGGLITILACMAIAVFVTIRMMRKFNAVSDLLSEASVRTKSQSESVSEVSSRVNNSAATAMDAISQTSSAISQISSMMERSKDNANASSNAAKESLESVVSSKDNGTKILSSINDIGTVAAQMQETVRKSNEELKLITSMIKNIADRTTLINDIVFQTKLLSFNASVEAARAGEHGKGFAVVAEEIGNLARSSGAASSEISKLLSESKDKVEQIIDSSSAAVTLVTNKISDRVVAGEKLVQINLQTLVGMEQQARDVESQVQQIFTAISEQSQGILEVNKALATLQESAKINQKNGESLSQNSDAGLTIGSDLDTAVQELKTIVSG